MIKWPRSSDRFAFTCVLFNCHLIENVWNRSDLWQTMGRGTQSAENNMWSVCWSGRMMRCSKRRAKSADPLSAIAVIRLCHVDQLGADKWLRFWPITGCHVSQGTSYGLPRGPIRIRRKGGGAETCQKSSKKLLICFFDDLTMSRFESGFWCDLIG